MDNAENAPSPPSLGGGALRFSCALTVYKTPSQQSTHTHPLPCLSTVRGQGFQTNSSSPTWSLCSRHCCSYYIRPRPHETGTDRRQAASEATSYVAAPLSLNGLPVGFTELRLSPTYDTHVALGLGTPTHPLAANCHSYLQHQGIPIFPYTKTEHTTHATTPTCTLAHSRAHTRTRQVGMCCCS
jgi:hypothetical protein